MSKIMEIVTQTIVFKQDTNFVSDTLNQFPELLDIHPMPIKKQSKKKELL